MPYVSFASQAISRINAEPTEIYSNLAPHVFRLYRGNFMPTTILNLDNIQGNSLGGFNKDFQASLFLKFNNSASARAWIAEIAGDVSASSSANVIQFNNQFSALRAQGIKKPEELISAVWVNLVISFQGMTALNIAAGDLSSFPPAFRAGMAGQKAAI